MPDLKSELSKVITSWNDDMSTTNTTPTITHVAGRRITVNSTRITFNYVRDNPGGTRVGVTDALEKLGVKRSSSTSLLSIMIARGNIRKTPDGALFPAQKEYAPIKPITTPKKPKVVAPVLAMPEAAAPVEWTVESVIGHLNIRQASAVYTELRKLFGG
jgi:hypothetical protein